MVGYIKEEFKNILKTLDWMEDDTRKSALEKADAVVDHIGYPDELLDDKKLEEVFQSVNINLFWFDLMLIVIVLARSARRSVFVFHVKYFSFWD